MITNLYINMKVRKLYKAHVANITIYILIHENIGLT